jgi:hypothetical protein
LNTISWKTRFKVLVKQYQLIVTVWQKRHGAGRPLMLFK